MLIKKTIFFFSLFLFGFLPSACQVNEKTKNSTNVESRSSASQISQSENELKSNYSLDSKVEFQYVRNAAFGYSFMYPIDFRPPAKEIFGIKELFSKDKKARMKFWTFDGEGYVDGATPKEKKLEKIIKYHKQLLEKKEEFFKDAEILKESLNRDELAFWIIGEKKSRKFIWKSELSEIAVSGDYIFKNMLFEYEKSEEKFYEPIAFKVANNFGHLKNLK